MPEETPEKEKHQCGQEGCNSFDTMQCHLLDYGDYKSEPKDIYEWYCAEHAHKNGYCTGCGEFWAGIESFDFNSSGLCENCKSELDSELDEDDEDCQYDDTCICEGCGRDVNGYDGDPCPLCCSHSYAPGSEECDWCSYSDECFKLYHQLGMA